MRPISRREMFGNAARAAGAITLGLPLFEAAGQAGMIEGGKPKLKVVIACAHPDDPETGCGETATRYSDLGHEVIIIYLAR